MRGITFEAFSLAEPRARRPDGAEPRLFTEPSSPPSEDQANADPGRLSEIAIGEAATAESVAEEPVAANSPRLAAPGGRLASASARLSAGAVFHLALVGLVASLTAGAFFGVGFLLLAGPEKRPIAAAAPDTSQPSPPASLEAGLPPHPAAAAATPSPTLMPRHQAENEPPPLPSIKPVPASRPAFASIKPAPLPLPTPPTPSPAQAVSTHPAPVPPARPVASAGRPIDVATGAAAPPSPRHAAPPHPVESRSTRVRRVAHTQAEPRHRHARSHRLARSPALSPPRVAQLGTPSRAGQTQAFDQLLTQLTAPGAPAGRTAAPPSLTPPPVGQPNPFAQRGASR